MRYAMKQFKTLIYQAMLGLSIGGYLTGVQAQTLANTPITLPVQSPAQATVPDTQATSTPNQTTQPSNLPAPATYSNDKTVAQMLSKYLALGANIQLQKSSKWTAVQKKCIGTIDENFATDDIQLLLQHQLTPAAFNAINDFYNSDLGKKFRAFTEQQVTTQFGRLSKTHITFSAAEKSQLRAHAPMIGLVNLTALDYKIEKPLQAYILAKLKSCALAPRG